MRRANDLLSKSHTFSVKISPSDWFYYSHEHRDWNGIGGIGPLIHRRTLEAHANVFRAYALALVDFQKPFQLWISLDQECTGQDAVFVHSANPYSEFPAIFDDVSWGLPALEAVLSEWLPEFELIAGKREWNYVVYAKHVGIPLEPTS